MARELPILMHGRSVRWILDHRKYQTRRPVKPQPPEYLMTRGDPHEMAPGLWTFPAQYGGVRAARSEDCIRCPYGAPGDLLWVRETWKPLGWDGDGWMSVRYRADHGVRSGQTLVCTQPHGDESCPWRPSIYMPKWASRIWLRVTDVRVERVQDISDEDARAEGVTRGDVNDHGGPARAFAAMWDELHGSKDGLCWDASPWVWVISFERVTSPGER